tara:strand:+ start:15279 stop:15539 length:261 start_codon:yes stop_codon:yes gene_type:complete
VKKGRSTAASAEEFIALVAETIRRIRIEKGKSQEEVAGLAMSVRTYVRIEKGEVAPTLRSIYHIAAGLGVEPSHLFNGIHLATQED